MFKKYSGLLLVSGVLAFPALAQEGHPLVGTWQGEWGASLDQQNFLTLILTWDGKNISGIANPGPDSVAVVKSVQLDSSAWTVHIEMDVQDDSGKTISLVADGKLDNVGSPFRTLTGTWDHEGEGGSFKVARQGGA